jgi:hypothetical protein
MDRQDRRDGEQAEEAEGVSEHERVLWPSVYRRSFESGSILLLMEQEPVFHV